MKGRQSIPATPFLLLILSILGTNIHRITAIQAAQPLRKENSSRVETGSLKWLNRAMDSSPVMFIENVGQFDEEARFKVQGGNRTIWLAEDAIWIAHGRRVYRY